MFDDIVKEDIGKQCIENNNIKCKQSVKITVVEKMCDVASIFNLLKHIEKKTKLKDVTFYSLSFVIDTIFYELKEMDKLHINANKVRILKGFIACFHYMSDKTCTCDRIIQGYIDVGMLDSKHKFWPEFYAIKKTKRIIITRSEMQMIEKLFSPLFKIMLETGHIPEKVYDDLVFPKDEVSGVVYDRNDGIEIDWTQRAKLLTHWFQQHQDRRK